MEGYVAAKARIFQGQRGAQSAIVGVDSPASRTVADHLAAAGHARLIRVAIGGDAAGGVAVIDGVLIDDTDGRASREIDLKTIPRLPGAHNWQNAAAAWAVARAAGIAQPAIKSAFATFPGLAHRQQLVRTIGGVLYVDDSKATNADAASKALGCYDRIYWIAGGRAKDGGLAGLEPFMERVVHAFLIGEAAPEFAQWLRGRVPTSIAGALDRAVPEAHAMAQADGAGVVLLSPACASFDQYPNFEVRGRAFLAAVRALDDGGAASPPKEVQR
jgi:UDP-N-acetylmuramoylalanine--D-glutamate ligase